jgi:hypothetical protein
MDKPANDTAAIVPTIHLNGTARETLITEYETTVRSLNVAISDMLAATCHPRDFYVQQDGTQLYEAFRAKRQQQVVQLEKIRDDMYEILGGLLEQGT